MREDFRRRPSSRLIMKELWRPIADYNGFYEVSNKGRVRSLDRLILNGKTGRGCRRLLRGRILKPSIAKGGYLSVGLHKIGPVQTFTVHILVFRAFVENPDDLPEINHKDGNKLNNWSTNLEPSTRQENVLHAIRLGLCSSMIGAENIGAKLTATKVRRIRRLFERGVSQGRIAKLVGTTFQNIHCIVRRKSWTHI